ncbi:protein of unknown function (plasmid) [Agrobacterium pusense]|uniref:Uncharacterized protein n=1 Tax=Agrobacterium pusense TaxID=648995 RepID=U4QDJ6_9HYPH|nr:protein of unknown function [Agrobacterium pusense]
MFPATVPQTTLGLDVLPYFYNP